MTNKEFIAELAQRTGYSPEDTQRMVNLLVETMGDRFQEDDTVLVPTFGTFEVKKKLERVMVNPSTGQRMLVPPKLVLNNVLFSFHADQSLFLGCCDGTLS